MENSIDPEVWPSPNVRNDEDVIIMIAAVSELIFLFLLNAKSLKVDHYT